MSEDVKRFEKRLQYEPPRDKDWRSPYARDNARIIHSAGFRRLQGKTQVMGPGEGDFHRTRLTHSLEVTQIGLGLLDGIFKRDDISIPSELKPYIEDREYRHVIAAACEAHDLGHPPFGHGGERALHQKMKTFGGFEGNAQTIRLLVKLEKYKRYEGVNPTRRFLSAVLKYPVAFSQYGPEYRSKEKPPKCYYDDQNTIIEWALKPFSEGDRETLRHLDEVDDKIKPKHKTFDASIMECADDIAYGTHDLEDIIARNLVDKCDLLREAELFMEKNTTILHKEWSMDDFVKLYDGSHNRKDKIGKLVNLLMTNTKIVKNDSFSHPLLKYNLKINENLTGFVKFLSNKLTYKMVIEKPKVQMLEFKGKRIISSLFDEYILAPERLIPHWGDMDVGDTKESRVCDYIAGMTDAFAAKMYHRLFTPGIGSSRDEL